MSNDSFLVENWRGDLKWKLNVIAWSVYCIRSWIVRGASQYDYDVRLIDAENNIIKK